MLDLRYEKRLVAWQGYFGQQVWKPRLIAIPKFWRELIGFKAYTAEDFIVFVYTMPIRTQEFLGWERLEYVERGITNFKSDTNEYIGKEMRKKYPWWVKIGW